MITFNNPGLIDLRAIKTFGVSVKESDNPIGFFGTGLKYAIAILLRNKQKITIYRGLEKYEFSSKTEIIRNEEFKIVTMNNEELGFTIDVGKNWELWMAYRELYSNMLDESGSVITEPPVLYSTHTNITIEGEEFEEIHKNKDHFILSKFLISKEKAGDVIEVFKNLSSSLFYKTFKVHELQEGKKYQNTYNILCNLQLTEDRTVKYEFEIAWFLSKLFLETKDKEMLKRMLLATEHDGEYRLDFTSSPYTTPSPTFMSVMEELLRDKGNEINPSAVKRFLTVNEKDLKPIPCEITDIEQEQLEKAKIFISSLGYQIDKYEIIITEFLGNNIYGLANMGEEKIYLSKNTFEKGTKFLTETLLEEYIHLFYKVSDCTRQLQDVLFTKIVSLGEIYIRKEAL